MAEPIRLQKYFSDCGILSRRAAEEEIRQGHVRVNGVTARVGDKIDPSKDCIEFRGRILPPPTVPHRVYLLLNKPRGYVSTAKDEKGRHTVTELVSSVGCRVYPVGRLDMDSDGLLLLTNDGALTERLTHPRHDIPKIYRVTLSKEIQKEELVALAAPMKLDGYPLRPIGIRPISPTQLELTLYEGRNRQIRRMCEAVGLRIVRLTRVAIGEIQMGSLRPGSYRHLTSQEIDYLRGTIPTLTRISKED